MKRDIDNLKKKKTVGDFNTLLSINYKIVRQSLEKEMQPTPVFLPGESQGRGA